MILKLLANWINRERAFNATKHLLISPALQRGRPLPSRRPLRAQFVVHGSVRDRRRRDRAHLHRRWVSTWDKDSVDRAVRQSRFRRRWDTAHHSTSYHSLRTAMRLRRLYVLLLYVLLLIAASGHRVLAAGDQGARPRRQGGCLQFPPAIPSCNSFLQFLGGPLCAPPTGRRAGWGRASREMG